MEIPFRAVVADSLALARRRRSRGVGCSRTLFSRRTHRRVVGLRSRGWPLRDTRTGEAGSGEHRSRESAGAQHFLSAEEPADPELRASRKQPASRSQPRPGAQTLHFASLDRAKLQAAKELPGLGSLPGTQGPIHPPSLASLVCCAFSFCWWASTECEDFGSPPVVVLKDDIHPSCRADEVGGGKSRARSEQQPLSWPRALRKVRSWLEPYVMLWRYWRAYSEKDPPRELKALFDRLFAAEGLYLYVH
jgi:hypothetical protein